MEGGLAKSPEASLFKTKISDLNSKMLLKNEIGMAAAHLAKIKKIRKFVSAYQKKLAQNPPRKFKGVCFDGRDIGYNIMPDANFKFFLSANIKTRAKRRFKELKKLKHKVKFSDVLKSVA